MQQKTNDIDPGIAQKLDLLREKYNVMGQDLSSYLDGLLHADYLTYWDYINLDTLLTLQQPKTPFPDEVIFITYHQITELYFKLILWEIEQIRAEFDQSADWFLQKIKRINRYFHQLADSFSIMVEGMSREEFLNFRMSLLPSSGFQSAQYRFIEIGCTDMINLVSKEKRGDLTNESDFRKIYEYIYWKEGASELATGEKTLTLKQFERKYSEELIKKMELFRERNLNHLAEGHLPSAIGDPLREELRKLDHLANVTWPLSHYKSAAKHLQKDPDVIAASGGTNWQKYLPPRFQKIIFFPSLWSDAEKEDWGKSWVQEVLDH